MKHIFAASTALVKKAGGRGFTLVELTVVVAITAVLASAAIPLYELTVKREKEQELRVGLRQIREALDAYKHAVTEGRITRQADAVFVVLEWLFVLLRIGHAYVHTTSNYVPTRFKIFAAGIFVLLIMWVYSAFKILTA